jgi:hypothetical protein
MCVCVDHRGGGSESQSRVFQEKVRNICRMEDANPPAGVSPSTKSSFHVPCSYLNYQLITTNSRILLEKMTVAQLVKTFPTSMNSKICYRIQTISPRVPILSQLNNPQLHISFLKTVLILICYLQAGRSRVQVPMRWIF